jgi:hypothetical protein
VTKTQWAFYMRAFAVWSTVSKGARDGSHLLRLDWPSVQVQDPGDSAHLSLVLLLGRA